MSLKSLFHKANLKLPQKKQDQLSEYANLIIKWNKTRNLVSRNANLETINEHILDCACLMPHLEERNLLDVGSGAGLPGLVISILDDKKDIKLLEPNQKKISFLTHAQAKLDLKNTTILKERIENLEEINEEIIITRAVMDPKKLLNIISKQKNKNLKIIMMVSEPVEISYPNWELKFLISEAQRVLGKNRGFLNITPLKN
ncbi:16S rRNA (guanine(527)-N(7))-methyltransferase RsmG [SAR86 cluster bacterium]|nr:16S rRNA (guanine(527)-N(7))-methyltransferase RsmG [SAR86 cluster bacterium]